MRYLKRFNESIDKLYSPTVIDDDIKSNRTSLSSYEKQEILKLLKEELPSYRIENATKNMWRITNKVSNCVFALFFKDYDDWYYVEIEDEYYKCDDVIGLKKLLKDKL